MTDLPTRSALEQRLELYRRYASVVDEQESALEDGDLDRFSELNITRRAIEAEVDAVHFSPEVVPDRATLDAVEKAIDMLQGLESRQKRMEDRLRTMRDGVGKEIGQVADRRSKLRTYLESAAGEGSLDVRS